MIDINAAKKQIDTIKQKKATLEGQKQQLQQHLDKVLMPKFKELEVDPTNIAETLAVEEQELQKGYNEAMSLINELNQLGV